MVRSGWDSPERGILFDTVRTGEREESGGKTPNPLRQAQDGACEGRGAVSFPVSGRDRRRAIETPSIHRSACTPPGCFVAPIYQDSSQLRFLSLSQSHVLEARDGVLKVLKGLNRAPGAKADGDHVYSPGVLVQAVSLQVVLRGQNETLLFASRH